MNEIVAHKCPNCGARLPASRGASFLKCDFCGREVDLRRPAPTPGPVVPGHVPPPRARPRARRGSTSLVGCMVTLAVVGAIGVGVFTVVSRTAGIPGGLGGGGLGGDRMIWQKTVGFVQVNGDAVEDLVLQVRFIDSNDQIHLVVFDGTNLSEIWRAGPFGNYSQAFQYTHTAVVGNRVLLTDFRAAAHLYDLASGGEIATFPLPDRAKEICVAPGGGTQAWVRVENENHAVVDTATGSTQPAPRPPWGEPCLASADLAAPKPPPQALEVRIPGFESEEVLSDGTLVVAVGQRAAGIRVPMAVGLGPGGQGALWTTVIPTVDEALYVEDSAHPTVFHLAGGRLFCAYSLQNDTGRVTALNAQTGARLWESELPKCCAHGVDVDAIRVGPTRVLIEQFNEAELFDIQTGQMIGRVRP